MIMPVVDGTAQGEEQIAGLQRAGVDAPTEDFPFRHVAWQGRHAKNRGYGT